MSETPEQEYKRLIEELFASLLEHSDHVSLSELLEQKQQ